MDNSISTELSNASTKENFLINGHISKFDLITKIISKNCIKKNVLHIIFKQNTYSNTLYMQLLYNRNTDFNPLNRDLVFSVLIDQDFPNSFPTVKSVTNFCFPSLYDNRNLLFSIINHNWINKHYGNFDNLLDQKIVEPIEEILVKIPVFVNRVMENTINKILVYYGDYKIDMIYDINEFLGNLELDFFKVNQHIKSKQDKRLKERYVVLTDIYFLFFDPVPGSRNFGKLVFWGDIRQIIPCKGGSNGDPNDSSTTIILEWKNSDKIIQFEISFINSTTKEFLDRSARKILRLKENYKIFQDDVAKPGDDIITSRLADLNFNSDNIQKMISLIKYKEELLDTTHSINLVRELMSLYQKVIEILSAKEDMDFKIYLEKLHKMLEDKEIQEELEKEKLFSQTPTKNLFELSNSYHVDEQDQEEFDEDY